MDSLCTLHCALCTLFFSFYLLQRSDNGVHPRIGVDIVDIDIAYNAFLIDDEDGPFGDPLGSKNIILQGHVTMGPEVTEHRERKVVAL
jgi:hypothetical protein